MKGGPILCDSSYRAFWKRRTIGIEEQINGDQRLWGEEGNYKRIAQKSFLTYTYCVGCMNLHMYQNSLNYTCPQISTDFFEGQGMCIFLSLLNHVPILTFRRAEIMCIPIRSPLQCLCSCDLRNRYKVFI